MSSVRSVTEAVSTSSLAATQPVLIPAGTATGDRMFWHVTYTSGLELAVPSGWTDLGFQIYSTQLSTRLFTRLADASEQGTNLVYTHSEGGRSASVLVIVAAPGTYNVIAPTAVENTANITIPGFTPAEDNHLALAFAGLRWSASTNTLTVTPPSGWTERVDDQSTNTTGQRIGAWAGSRTYGASTAGVPVAAQTATASEVMRSAAWLVDIAPVQASGIIVNAGADKVAYPNVVTTTTGTSSGGSGVFVTRAWTQVSGPAVTMTGANTATMSFTAPMTAATRTFRYTVTDSLGATGYDEVTMTTPVSPYRAIIGGVEVPLVLSVPRSVAPPPAADLFQSCFAGGGGQAAVSVSPFDDDLVAGGTDTGGVRLTTTGYNDAITHCLGYDEPRSRQTDGVKWSRLTKGRLFMTCGDGTSGNGGVYVSENCDTRAPTPWKRLDGVAGPELVFDGGNSNVAGAPPSPYPRHYGRVIEIDEVSIAGFTLIHLATVTDGAWRIKVRNSDLTPVEQVRYGGTAGKYIRCIQMATYAPNEEQNSYSRILIADYFDGSPKPLLVCTTANDSAATPTLSTTAVSGLTNIEAMGFINSPAGQAVTIFAKNGSVRFSINAFSAAPGSITSTEVAAASGAPETSQRWISVGTTNSGSTYVVLVGTFGGVGGSGSFNTMWRGTWTEGSTTPWSAVSWTAINASHMTIQLMGQAGGDNTWWLGGSNTPGINGTAAVSAFATSGTNPSRMYLVARGNTYRSDNYGLDWYPVRVWGSANHSYVSWDQWQNKSNFAGSTGDWPLVASTDVFVTEPQAVIRFSGAEAGPTWFDPKTGELFFGYSEAGGTSLPALDNSNTVLRIPAAALATEYTSKASFPKTDYLLNTGNGATGNPRAGVQVGATAYGNGGIGATRAVIVGTMGGGGMWYTRNEGATWTKITTTLGTTQPFGVSGSRDSGQAFLDQAKNLIYFFDRNSATVWRMSIANDGTVSQATPIFRSQWTYGVVPNGAGYLDLDVANDRIWVSTSANVWFISNASTVAGAQDTSRATATGWSTYYPGEIVGPMCFIPKTGTVMVCTHNFDAAGKMLYPKNNTFGPRIIEVSSPTSPLSWAPANANDWTESRDSAYKVGWISPHGLARNWDGTIITMTQQGTGVGKWDATGGGTVTPPEADPWLTRDSNVVTASTALYAIYGVLWSDPGGNVNVAGDGVDKTALQTITFQRLKPATGINKSVQRFGDAALALGGTAVYDTTGVSPNVKDRVTISGVAVNLKFAETPSIITGASGKQVRMFLAAIIEGEGSVDGMIMDDPDIAHINVVKNLVEGDRGYNVVTSVSDTSFKVLSTTADYFPRIQAYPFVVWGRVPGGKPAGA